MVHVNVKLFPTIPYSNDAVVIVIPAEKIYLILIKNENKNKRPTSLMGPQSVRLYTDFSSESVIFAYPHAHSRGKLYYKPCIQ